MQKDKIWEGIFNVILFTGIKNNKNYKAPTKVEAQVAQDDWTRPPTCPVKSNGGNYV